VLLSQLITYATGGVNARNLPKARIYCAWEGMKEFLTQTPGHPPRSFYLTADSWAYFRDLLIGERLFFLEEPGEIVEGIIFEPTGGHHPGSAGVRIQTDRGLVGILETAFVQENIDLETPIGIAENAAQCREVIRRYRKSCALVIAGHEPAAATLIENFFA
jgi:glyoxylase-like metal-dependent hydrolase (beta-lactamase superfamily II)